jgi:phosphoribosylaminoimidazole-succinocarboxamide synthase
VRRVASGSLVKRFPQYAAGQRLEELVLEYTLKDDDAGDPFITREEVCYASLTHSLFQNSHARSHSQAHTLAVSIVVALSHPRDTISTTNRSLHTYHCVYLFF